jgi:hypothetical protein
VRIIYIGLMVSVASFSCGKNQEAKLTKSSIRQIVKEEFNDLAIQNLLIPVIAYEDWLNNKEIEKTIRNGEEIIIPPPPSIDTFVVSNDHFEDLEKKSKMERKDYDFMYESILTRSSARKEFIEESYSEFTFLDSGLNEIEHYNPRLGYYQFSIPIFNKDKRLMILMVNKINGPASKGFRCLFEWTGKSWQLIDKNLSWIT